MPSTRPRRVVAGGESPVTIGEVAARAGVSIATVSRVMNGVTRKASATTAERVRQAIADLGYRPSSAGRTLRQRQSVLVGVLATNLANTAMAAVAASIETALRDAGFGMVLCDTHDRPDVQDEYLLQLRAERVRAIVLLGAVASPRLTEFRDAHEPLLFVNRRDPGQATSPFVGIDNRLAGRDAADFLLARRVRVPAIVHASLGSSATADRVDGIRQRYRERGEGAELPSITFDGLGHLDIGYRAADCLVRAGDLPGGLLCLSDLIAYGAYRRLREAAIEVPRGCLIVGFDDNPLNDWVAPWLTSVRIPYDRFGSGVLGALQAIWAGGSAPRTMLGHQLVVRG